MRGQHMVASWKSFILWPGGQASRGRNPIARNAMKTHETWNRPTDEMLWYQTFSNIVHIIMNSLESSYNAYNSTAPPK